MSTKYIIGTLIALLLAAGIGSWYLSQQQATSSDAPPYACPALAKECPDGSYVGATGPDCAFVCPASTTTTTTTTTSTSTSTRQAHNGTLQGSMTIGPICPVEQAGHPCNPTPEMYAAHQVFVYDSNREKLIVTLTPDAQGTFSATLPAGAYLIDVAHQSVGAVRGVPTTIHITSGQTATIAISIDTGIR